MRQFLLMPVLIGIMLSTPSAGQEEALQAATPQIAEHIMIVSLMPDEHSLLVNDSITLTGPSQDVFTFTLNKNLEITEIQCDGVLVEFEIVPYEGGGTGETSETETVQTIRAFLPVGATVFGIRYEGEIYDPIDASGALGRVRGDYTSGIISPDGIYLSSGTGWYPDTEESMAVFNFIIRLPETWSAVTQGDLSQRWIEDGHEMSIWESAIPADGCVLVANEYHIRSRTIDGIECSTYFYEDEIELSNEFLDKLEQYLPVYQELFGPLPYSRFDIAENFFTTGYGMPGFTLLGSRVLRMPYATAEGSLAHELVHNWWGNGVFVDWDKGNWCEGITYFSTNYYWSVLQGNDDDAEDFRFRSMVRYSVEVNEDEDYPVRRFRTKMTEEDGDIGYGKASAIFIMLHEMLGEDKFFEACRMAIERYLGKKTTWDDLRAVFEEVAGEDLSDFFSSWLDNTGTPKLRFEDISQHEEEDGNHLEFNLMQDGDQFHFDMPIFITLENHEFPTSFPVFSMEQHCEFLLDEPVVSIEFDPHHYIFRRLGRDEIPPGLNTTLEADSLLVVIPSEGDDDLLERVSHMGPHPGPREVSVTELYEELAESVAVSMENVIVKYDDDVTEEDLMNSSVLSLGAWRYNTLVPRLFVEIGEHVTILEDGFVVGGNSYFDESHSMLVTVRNPYNDDYDITFYLGNSPLAIYKANFIFFYGWDSFVVYENGNVTDRGEWDMGEGPYYSEL